MTTRRVVYSVRQFEKIVEEYNTIQDVYVSLYDLNLIIDKIWIELDSRDLEQAYDEACRIVEKLRKLSLPYIVVFSGLKGFHFYILFKPLKMNRDVARETIRSVITYIVHDLELKTLERLGYLTDVRRMVRVPTTMHMKSRLYAVILPPSLDISLREILYNAKHNINTYVTVPETLPDIRDYYVKSMNATSSIEVVSEKTFTDLSNIDIVLFLKNLVRPCVAEAVYGGEPPHLLRFDLVAELYWLGFTEDEIVEICRKLNWRDFDEKITRYQVRHIISHRYKPLTCRELRQFVKCTRCGYYYWWRWIK